MDRSLVKLLIGFGALVVVAVVVLLAYPESRPATRPPLPNPNGYDDLIRAGNMLPATALDYRTISEEELQTYVKDSTNALQLARVGLGRECLVPLQPSEVYWTSHVKELSALRRLSQAFAAQAELVAQEGHTNDAAKVCLELIHLGIESGRGGVLIDQMIGTAIESVGTQELKSLADQLDAGTIRQTVATLESLDSQRQSWDAVMQQERSFSRATYRGLRYRLASLVMRGSMKKSEQRAEQKYREGVAATRQLLIELAARGYELEKGSRPADVAALVPGYLKAIPRDPFTGTNMVFSP